MGRRRLRGQRIWHALLQLMEHRLGQRAVLAAIIGWALVLAVRWAARPDVGLDFKVFYRAAARFAAGTALYVPADGHFVFKYAPPAVLLLAPLAWFDERYSMLGWNLLNASGWLCLVVGGWRALRAACQERAPAAPGAGRGASLPVWVALLSVLVVPRYMVDLLRLGQSEGVLLGLVATVYLGRRWAWWVAAALALALFIKPPIGLVVLGVCALRPAWWWRLGVAAVGCNAALLMFHDATWLLEQWRGWWQILSSTTGELIASAQNQSLWAVLAHYGGVTAAAVRWLLLPAAALFVWVGWRLRAAVLMLGAGEGAVAPVHPLKAHADLWWLGWLLAGSSLLSPLGWRAGAVVFPLLVQASLALGWELARRRLLRRLVVLTLVWAAMHQLLGSTKIWPRMPYWALDGHGIALLHSVMLVSVAAFLAVELRRSSAPQKALSLQGGRC